MKYLLDTHTLLWFLKGDKKLSDGARQLSINRKAISFSFDVEELGKECQGMTSWW